MNEKDLVALLGDLKHRVFPRPFERLAVSGRDLIGVEIGVYKGAHAESLLTHLDIKTLYLVDPYELYSEYEEGQNHYGVDHAPLHLAKKEAMDRLAPYAGRLTWMFALASDAARQIPDDVDFVYIDGNHQESFV